MSFLVFGFFPPQNVFYVQERERIPPVAATLFSFSDSLVSKSQREGANDERIASRTGGDAFERKFLFF